MQNLAYFQQVRGAVSVGKRVGAKTHAGLNSENTGFSIGMGHEEQAAQLGFDSQNELDSNCALTPFNDASQTGSVPMRTSLAILVPLLPRHKYPSWPKYFEGDYPVEYVLLSDALSQKYDFDGFIQAYSCPGVERRLATAAVFEPENLNALGGCIPMVIASFDVDPPDHAFTDQWWSREIEKLVKVLEDHPAGFVYRTRNGYRIIYLLEFPFELRSKADADEWSRQYVAWANYLNRRYGITCDPTRDWTRLFRVPHATRPIKQPDGTMVAGTCPEDLEVIGDPEDIGIWSPELLPDDWPAKELAKPPKSPKAPKPRALTGPTNGVHPGLFYQLLVNRDELGDELEPGNKWCVPCPLRDEHSDGDTHWDPSDSSTALYAASEPGGTGNIYCAHSGSGHEANLRTPQDWLGSQAFSQDEIDQARVDMHDELADELPTVDEPLRGLKHLQEVAVLGEELGTKPIEPVSYSWYNIVVSGTICEIAAPVGHGKTTLLVLALVARMNCGEPVNLLGYEVEPAPQGQRVVIIENENTQENMRRKIEAACQMLGVDGQSIKHRYIMIARKDVRIGSPHWRDIVTMSERGLVSDIAIDTLASSSPIKANPDSEKDQAAIFADIKKAIDVAPDGMEPTVWIGAHMRKNGDGGTEGVSGSLQRTGQGETVLTLKANKVDGEVKSVEVTFQKLREAVEEHPRPVTFTTAQRDGHWSLEYPLCKKTPPTSSATTTVPNPDAEAIRQHQRKPGTTYRNLQSHLGWSDRRFRAAWNAAKAGANTTVALDTGTGEKPNDINASQCFRQEFPISPANGSIESSRHHLASDASAHASLDAFNAEASKTPGKVKLPPASGARKADASAASTPYRGVEAEARGTVVVCCADNNPTQSVRGEPRVQHGARDVATSSVRADAKVHGDKQTANDPVQASNASEFLVHQEHRPNHYNITALEGRDATSVPGNVLVAGSGRPSTKLSTNDSWVSYQETWNEQRGEEPQSNPNTHEVTPTDCDGDRDEDHDDWSDDELSEGARAERYHNEQRMAFRLMRKARPSNGNGGYLMLAHDRLVHMTRVLA